MRKATLYYEQNYARASSSISRSLIARMSVKEAEIATTKSHHVKSDR